MKISDNMSPRDKTKSNRKPGRDLNVVLPKSLVKIKFLEWRRLQNIKLVTSSEPFCCQPVHGKSFENVDGYKHNCR